MDVFFKRLSLSLLLIFLSTSIYAAQFDKLVSFGNSLSDTGNVNPNPANRGFAPWTNNHGPLWVNFLANSLGVSIFPSSFGGTNFSIFADQTDSGFPSQNCPFELPNCGVTGQVINFLKTSPHADPHALYTIWAGANDLAQQVTTLDIVGVSLSCASDPTSPGCRIASSLFISKAESVGATAVSNIVSSVQMLHSAGAKYFLINNLPAIGEVPFFNDPRLIPLPFLARDLLTPLFNLGTMFFNQTLSSALSALPYDVIQVDLATVFQYILQNPGRFGYTDTTDALCSQLNLDPTSPSFGRCLSANALKPVDPNTFLFFDSFHPTEATQKLIAQYAFSYLEGPTNFALLAQTPFRDFQIQQENITNQLVTLNASPLPCKTGRLFISGDYAHQRESALRRTALPSFRSDDGGIGLGGYFQFNEHAIVGASGAVVFNNPRTNVYRYNLNEYIGSLFGQYQYGRSYVNAIFNIGKPEFKDIKREIAIDTTSFTSQNAATSGWHYGAMGNAYLNIIQTDNLLFGPLVSLEYQTIDVNGYTERGLVPGANLRYFNQDNDSFITSGGLQATYLPVCFRIPLILFGNALYNNQFLRGSGDRTIRFSTVSLPGSHGAVPVTGQTGSYGSFNGGVSAFFTRGILLTLAAKANVGNDNFSDQIYSLTFSIPV